MRGPRARARLSNTIGSVSSSCAARATRGAHRGLSAKENSVMKSSVVVALTLSASASFALLPAATAQIAQSGYALPLDLAMDAANTAIDACKAKGWPVSAIVVDTSGVIKVELKGDHSTIHTKDSAYRKAYTV